MNKDISHESATVHLKKIIIKEYAATFKIVDLENLRQDNGDNSRWQS